MPNIISKRSLTIYFLLAITWALSACEQRQAQIIDPTPVPTPACTPVPQMTGEKIIRPTVEATPHPQIAPGETLSLTFSGDYLIQNNQLVCGENREVVDYYLSNDELPGWSWKREVIIWLGEQELQRVDCYFTCNIEVEIPADTLPGEYRLKVANYGRFAAPELEFVLKITDPNQ